jgi:Asp-tRNA(Asn)/Glu-tRNA(Gln) amidotransferase A subunit family amidase
MKQIQDIYKILAESKSLITILEKNLASSSQQIKYSIKDNYATEGILTTCGSKILSNWVPNYSSDMYLALEGANYLCVGKDNMDSFAAGTLSNTSYFGAVKYPGYPTRPVGGSSGGSAVNVGFGISDISVNSDTGGSNGAPACYLGILGFKPSKHALSRYGVVILSHSYDSVSIMARDISVLKQGYSILREYTKKHSRDLTTRQYKECTISDTRLYPLDCNQLLNRLPMPINDLYRNIVFPEFYCAMNRYDGLRYGHILMPNAEHNVETRWNIGKSVLANNQYFPAFNMLLDLRLNTDQYLSRNFFAYPVFPEKLDSNLDDISSDTLLEIANTFDLPRLVLHINGKSYQIIGPRGSDIQMLDLYENFILQLSTWK